MIYSSPNSEREQLVTEGTITVLNFWFIGCVPCRQEIPLLNRLVSQYDTVAKIQFIAIALDKPDDLKEFLKENEFKYQVKGNGKRATVKANVSSYPTNIIINEQGIVVQESPGYGPYLAWHMSQKIDALLGSERPSE